MTARARAFGIEADETDSSDVTELSEMFQERVDYVRKTQRPFFQVVHTYRLAAHSKGDDTRAKEELALHWEQDPLLLNGLKLDEAERTAILAKVNLQIEDAIHAAEQAKTATASIAQIKEDERKAAPIPLQGDTFVRALNRGLFALMESNDNVFVMGEDMLDAYGGAFGVSKGLSTAFPNRVVPSPISEAGLVAWGVGAALAGMIPIVEIMFGDFLALAADQILNHAAKYRWISNERVNVPLVIRTPMGGGRGYGPTHSQSIEKMFLGIPGLQVVAPNLLLDPGELLRRCAAQGKNPTLFIEHKLLYPQPLYAIEKGRLGNFYVRFSKELFPTAYISLTDFENPDVCIMAYGGMAATALEAAERLLLEYEIAATVIIPSCLYPHSVLDMLSFIDYASLIVTVEEGQGYAGWGAEMIAGIQENTDGTEALFLRIAAGASPLPASLLLEKSVLPSVDGIIDAILRKLQ
jgi:2-oxoisovalerate dehydrogenase E1 component